ncbi:MAG: hypothetical protein IJ816_04445 [Alloprevotella sp.]|nr:hypothetical protein [Alloprevotella sp.]
MASKEIDRVLFKDRDSWHDMNGTPHKSEELEYQALEVYAMQERLISKNNNAIYAQTLG